MKLQFNKVIAYMRINILCIVLLFSGVVSAQIAKQSTYTNPVLPLDYSDPDAIRVGDAYYMTASSFNHVPGAPYFKILRFSALAI